VGDGICQPNCQVSECYFDLGDCSISKNICDFSTCDPSWIGDGYCDSNITDKCPFNTEACNYDNGDCWCSPNCPNPLLVNGICDPGCDVPECYHDYGDCDCVVNCTRWMLSNNVCDPQCNNPDCDFDSGDCLNERVMELGAYATDMDFSTFYVAIYLPNATNCPVVTAIPSTYTNYDQNSHNTSTTANQPPPSNTQLVAVLSSYNQFFGHCYSSYLYGFYFATRHPWMPHDGNTAILYYGCDSECNNLTCWYNLTMNNGDCKLSNGNYWHMAWQNSVTRVSFSLCFLLTLLFARFF